MKIKQFALLLLLIIASMFGLTGCSQRLSLENKEFVSDIEIDKISMNEITMPVEIKTDSNLEFPKIEYYTHEKYKLSVSIVYSSKTLKIERENKNTIFSPTYTFDTKCKTTIYLPDDYSGVLDLKIVTGSLKIEDASMKEIDAKVTTGDVSYNKLNVEEDIETSVVTGKINISSITAKELNINTTSGKINLENTTVTGRIETKVISGATNLNNVKAESFSINSTTGDLELKSLECETLIDVKATTGMINLSVVGKKEEYTTRLSSKTGETTGANEGGEKKITCDVITGTIKVKYLG